MNRIISSAVLIFFSIQIFAQITPGPKIFVQMPSYSYYDQSLYRSPRLGCTPGMSYVWKKGGKVVFENSVEENVIPPEDFDFSNHPYRSFLVFPAGTDYTFEYTNTSKKSSLPNLIVFFKSNGDGHFYEKTGALNSPLILAQGQIQKGGTYYSPPLPLIDDASPHYPSYSLPNNNFAYYKKILLNIRENGKISLKDFMILDITDQNRESTYNNYATGFGWWVSVNEWQSTILKTHKLKFWVKNEPHKYITVSVFPNSNGSMGNYTVLENESSGHLSINEEDVSMTSYAMVKNISGTTQMGVPPGGNYNPNGADGYDDNYNYGMPQFYKLGNDVYWVDNTASMSMVNPNPSLYNCDGGEVFSLALSNNEVKNIPAIGGQQAAIEVTTNTNWTASTSDNWITILTNTSDKLNYTVSENNGNTAREGSITVNISGSSQTIKISQDVKKAQQITFESIRDKLINDLPFKLVANSTSGLAVIYKVLSGPATMQGDLLTLSNLPGTVTVEASQEGNPEYLKAESTTQSFNVNKLSQSFTFEAITDKSVADSSFVLPANTSAGLPISYIVTSGPATVAGNKVILQKKSGLVEIQASQNGNENYEAINTATQSFKINKVAQNIKIETIGSQLSNVKSIIIKATSNSTEALIYTLLEGPATLANNTINLTGSPGKVSIEVSQAATEYYEASKATVSFDVILLLGNEPVEAISIVFPNPVANEVTIKSKQNITSANIYSEIGLAQELSFQKINNKTLKANLSNVPVGLYFLELNYQNRKSEIIKLQVLR